MLLQTMLFMCLLLMSDKTQPDTDKRQLLIFGKSENALLVNQQVQLLNKESSGVEDRDLKIIVVEKNSFLLKKYKVKLEDFVVILVGKDGFEKYRTKKLLSPEKLFSMIDAMPMRKAEIARKKN